MDDADIENKYDQVFTFAPGEGQHPLSLYQDTDAEYLCFPSTFVVRGRLAKMKDQFQFIIVTLLNGNCEVWIGELFNQFQTYFLNIRSYK